MAVRRENTSTRKVEILENVEQRNKTYSAFEVILFCHQFDLLVMVVVLDSIVDEVVVDRAPEDVGPRPLNVHGVMGRAGDVQD